MGHVTQNDPNVHVPCRVFYLDKIVRSNLKSRPRKEVLRDSSSSTILETLRVLFQSRMSWASHECVWWVTRKLSVLTEQQITKHTTPCARLKQPIKIRENHVNHECISNHQKRTQTAYMISVLLKYK